MAGAASNQFADIITKKPGGKKAMKNMKRGNKRAMRKHARKGGR